MNRYSDGSADEEEMPTKLAHDLASLRPDDPRLSVAVLRVAGEGVLPPDLEAAAQEYLSRTAAARELIEELERREVLDADGEARLLARITQETKPSDAKSAVWSWRGSAAAVIAGIAVAGAAIFVTTRKAPDAAAPPPGVIAPPAAGPAEAPAASFQLPLERPDLRISLKALTWRGAADGNPVLAALKPAFDAFRADDFARAEREFTGVSQRYPDLIEVALYQGVSRLFLDDTTGAIQSLQRASTLANPAFAADVAWYLAVAEERAGQVAAARERLLAACRADSGNDRACRSADLLK